MFTEVLPPPTPTPTMQEQRSTDSVPADGDSVAQCHDDWAFIAGFRDCAADAVRYLTQVERLPENDVFIRGLCQHLSTREPDIVWCERARSASCDEGYTSMCVDDSTCTDGSSSLGDDDSVWPCCVASETATHTHTASPGGPTGHTPDVDVEDTLVRLARCDPRIASLTKEIFDLIDDETDDDDDDEGDYVIGSTRL